MNSTTFLTTTRIKISVALFSILILGVQQATAITIYTGTPFKVYYASSNIVGPCTASNAWTGSKQENVTSFTQFTGSNFRVGTYRFSFDCTDGNGKVANNYTDLTVIPSVVSLAFTSLGAPNPYVEPPLTLSFTSDYYNFYPRLGMSPGRTSTKIRWNFSDVQGTCKASGSWATALPGKLASSGIYGVSMSAGNSDYSITEKIICTSSRGTVLDTNFNLDYTCRGPNCP